MHLLLYFFFVQVTLLVPGYAYFKTTHLLKDSPGLQLCLGYVISLVVYGLFATVAYAFKVDPAVTKYLCWVYIIIGAGLFIKQRLYTDMVALRFPLLCLLAINIVSLSFISLSLARPYTIIPDPQPRAGQQYGVFDVKVLNVAQTRANDNYIPYRQAQFFVNRSNPATDSFIGEWGVSFFERTPLLGAVTANYFNLLSDKPPIGYVWNADAQDPSHTFIKFQIIAQILNGLLILPAFFLISSLLTKRTALISCLFLVCSQYFIYNAFFSWPKSLVAFFVLTSWLLLLRRTPRSAVAAGVVSGIAYLTHDLAILYIGASFFYLLLSKRFRDSLLFLGPGVIFAAPWLMVASLKYHNASSFVYYPFSIKGIPEARDGKQIIHQFFHTSPFKIIGIRLHSLFYLLSPYQLFTSEGGQQLGRRLWALGIFSIPGALGIGLILPAYLGLVNYIKRIWPIAFILLPVLLCTLIIGWQDGLGALHFAEAVVVVWSSLAVYYLLQRKKTIALITAFIINSAQLIFFTLYSYGYHSAIWFHSIHSVLALLLLLGVTGVSGTAVALLAGKHGARYQKLLLPS